MNPISYVNTVDFPHEMELLRTGTSVKHSDLAIWCTDRRIADPRILSWGTETETDCE